MNTDTETVASPENTPTGNVATPTVETPKEALTLDDVKKKVFDSGNFEGVMNELAKFSHIENLQVERNFDEFEEIPDGFSIVITPVAENITKEGEKGRRVKSGIQVFAIPTVEALLQSGNEHAVRYVADRIQDALVAKAKNSVGSEDGLPLAIGDFVRSGRGDGTLAVFNDMAPGLVKVLKTKGFKHLDQKTLRRVFESASFSEKEYPKVSQKTWSGILGRLVEKATAEGDDPSFFADCVANRANKDFSETEDIDLTDLEI